MHPNLNFFLFQIPAYSFFTVAALVTVVGGGYWFARKRGFKAVDSWLMLLGMGFAVFIGARLFNIVVNFEWYREDPSRIFSLTATGFSLYGGIVLAILVGALISYLRKIPLLRFADTVTPFIGIGIALMRVGCFLNGCCFGKETDLPWGVTFPPFSPAHLHQMSENILGSTSVNPVHPTQIYELFAALVGTYLAFILIKRGKADGSAFLAAGIWFSAFRWFNMYLRDLPYSDAVIHYYYPMLYMAVILVCGFVLTRHERSECLPLHSLPHAPDTNEVSVLSPSHEAKRSDFPFSLPAFPLKCPIFNYIINSQQFADIQPLLKRTPLRFVRGLAKCASPHFQ